VQKIYFGSHFGRIFHKPTWSPCSLLSRFFSLEKNNFLVRAQWSFRSKLKGQASLLRPKSSTQSTQTFISIVPNMQANMQICSHVRIMRRVSKKSHPRRCLIVACSLRKLFPTSSNGLVYKKSIVKVCSIRPVSRNTHLLPKFYTNMRFRGTGPSQPDAKIKSSALVGTFVRFSSLETFSGYPLQPSK
jgi:hypothetical protein